MRDKNDIRSAEDFAWLDRLGWKRYLPPIARQLNDFLAYRRFCKHATKDEIWKLNRLEKEIGITNALDDMIDEMELKRNAALHEKSHYIYEQNKIKPVNFEQLEEEFEEERRWSNLTPEQRKIKTMPWPAVSGSYKNVPDEIAFSQPVLEEMTDDDGVTYKIFDKIYQYYHAVVYSPSRIQPDGVQGAVVIRDTKIKYMRNIINMTLHKEQEINNIWKRQQQPQSTQNNNYNNITGKVNIDHVKDAMGLNESKLNNRLNGDIF